MLPQGEIIIIAAIALLVVFLSFITAIKYAMNDSFNRTRAIMSAFLFFIVVTLTLSFSKYTLDSLPYSVPSFILGSIAGYLIGVRTDRKKINVLGIERYMEHFAHIHIHDIKSLTWWSIINFYSIMGGLFLINLVGLSTILFQGYEALALLTCGVGAFLVGTLVPYIFHLWSISPTYKRAK